MTIGLLTVLVSLPILELVNVKLLGILELMKRSLNASVQFGTRKILSQVWTPSWYGDHGGIFLIDSILKPEKYKNHTLKDFIVIKIHTIEKAFIAFKVWYLCMMSPRKLVALR